MLYPSNLKTISLATNPLYFYPQIFLKSQIIIRAIMTLLLWLPARKLKRLSALHANIENGASAMNKRTKIISNQVSNKIFINFLPYSHRSYVVC